MPQNNYRNSTLVQVRDWCNRQLPEIMSTYDLTRLHWGSIRKTTHEQQALRWSCSSIQEFNKDWSVHALPTCSLSPGLVQTGWNGAVPKSMICGRLLLYLTLSLYIYIAWLYFPISLSMLSAVLHFILTCLCGCSRIHLWIFSCLRLYLVF